MRLPITPTGQHHPRRGVTLVEMLVTLAVLLLMMTAIVQIFQAATGTLSASRAYQEIDTGLRRVDGLLRGDLAGVTAKMTPPNNPQDNRGYFEYGENAFADLQGEDCDDYVRFTTKAPPDRPFMGRFWPRDRDGAGNIIPSPSGPIMITSQYAEVIYFLRNGNLYRRVFLIAPERQSSLLPMTQNVGPGSTTYVPNLLGGTDPVSWQGMNDLSARPSATGVGIVLNTLGDLSNRENRAFSPRFANDFVIGEFDSPNQRYITPLTTGYDQTPDDFNSDAAGNVIGDGVPDFYPSLYYNCPLIFEGGTAPVRTGANAQTMAFPYVFPGAYSHPDPYTLTSGWLHSPNPDNSTPSNYFQYLQRLNHNPLDIGDNLPRPTKTTSTSNSAGGYQTLWVFPTWRETLSKNWTDPSQPINTSSIGFVQPPGLVPRLGTATTAATGLVADDANLLPPMGDPGSLTAGFFNVMRPTPQPYSDAMGGSSGFMDTNIWNASWEDDLVMTGVRSFDIKVLDNSIGEFVDLGWGDDARHPIANAYYQQNGNAAPFLSGNPTLYYDSSSGSNVVVVDGTVTTTNPTLVANNQPAFSLLGETFAHEGRMPPLVTDQRYDAQFGAATYPNPSGNTYTGNIGDNTTSLVRLRRVWDSWTTAYTAAPARGFDPTTKMPIGPPFWPPVYPSYPPPYPAALRGLQIQIRVQDPTGKYVKSLTIRQDFTDKL